MTTMLTTKESVVTEILVGNNRWTCFDQIPEHFKPAQVEAALYRCIYDQRGRIAPGIVLSLVVPREHPRSYNPDIEPDISTMMDYIIRFQWTATRGN